METKKMVAKAKWQWHTSRRVYYVLLLESCLDLRLRKKVLERLNYHTSKIKELA